MLGLVFREFLNLVEQEFSIDMVDDIIDACDLPSDGAYTNVGNYQSSEMLDLVTALSQKTGIAISDLVYTYGKFLFNRFKVRYPDMFSENHDAFSFLKSVDGTIHREVKKLYPQANLPRFECKEPDERTLVMVYTSERPMQDLAHGLIRGCLEHYETPATITIEDKSQKTTHVVFTIIKE